MNFNADFLRHRGEIARALRNRKFDFTEGGIYVPSMRANVAGVFESWLNGADHQVHPNLIPLEGRQHVLNAVLKNGSQVGTWYCSIFSGNVAPADDWTGVS